MAIEQQEQQKLFSTLITVLREQLGDFRSKKKKIFMHSGTYQIILYPHFITMMRGFLSILCVVLTIYCSAPDRFQNWKEMTSSRRAYVLLALSPTNGSKHCLPLAGDG